MTAWLEKISAWQFWEAVRWDLPALVLFCMLLAYAWSLWMTQRRRDFDFPDMYRDERGKPSTSRVLSVGAWVVTSWVLMQDALDGVTTTELFWAYALVWSASKPLEKAVEKWNGTFPWAGGAR